MPNVIQHKRNSTAGLVPSTGSLNQGELAINIGDGKFYTKNSSNSVINLGVTSISGTLITPASGNFLNSLSVNNLRLNGNTLSSTSGNIIINPSGTEPLQRDGAGNTRGNYATDWQATRSSGTMVASGFYSVISGGTSNTASNIASTVGGGQSNTASGSRATVGGGYNNSASNSYSTVGGGRSNSASNSYSTAGGGYNNNASGDHSTVGGGKNNSASASYSTAGGGYNNNASGDHSTVGGGYNNQAAGDGSAVLGGQYNLSQGTYSTILGGSLAKTTRYGELSHAAGAFNNNGDAQHSILIARLETTNNTANQVLFLDAASSRLILPPQTSWSFTIKLSAYNSTDNQGGWWIIRGGIRRNNSNNTSLVGSLITESGFESSLNAAAVSVVSDDTNEALEIRVTGVTGKTIRWVAVVDISQVSSGTP